MQNLRHLLTILWIGNRHAIPIAQDQGNQVPGIPVTRKISPGVRETAPEPAKAGVINPGWNPNLVSRKKGYGGADAMDCRAVVKVLLKIEA
jgi:hypothetical protein